MKIETAIKQITFELKHGNLENIRPLYKKLTWDEQIELKRIIKEKEGQEWWKLLKRAVKPPSWHKRKAAGPKTKGTGKQLKKSKKGRWKRQRKELRDGFRLALAKDNDDKNKSKSNLPSEERTYPASSN